MRYSFSGHESFHCKSLWLKKGYDYLLEGKSFNDTFAVVNLGVGKNMVSSIRFWLKAFELQENDVPTSIANYIFNDEYGVDPFCEDIATLWILHFHLVKSAIASIYNLTFIDFQKERKEFDKNQLQGFIKRMCSVPEQKNVYNENTVKKDINVILQTYVSPTDLKQIERFTSLLLNLELIREIDEGNFRFNETAAENLPLDVLLYSLLSIKEEDIVISFDKIQYLSLLYCLPVTKMLGLVVELEKKYPNIIEYTDNSGIRNIHFKKELNPLSVLNNYYLHSDEVHTIN